MEKTNENAPRSLTNRATLRASLAQAEETLLIAAKETEGAIAVYLSEGKEPDWSATFARYRAAYLRRDDLRRALAGYVAEDPPRVVPARERAASRTHAVTRK